MKRNTQEPGKEYYKLILGPLQIMGRPILAGKWKRITFLYTTGELFCKAYTINELLVKTDEGKSYGVRCGKKAMRRQHLQG